jgi:hypothetical protein
MGFKKGLDLDYMVYLGGEDTSPPTVLVSTNGGAMSFKYSGEINKQLVSRA